jgi:hypothetical protein
MHNKLWKGKAHNASAKSAGRNAKVAEEVYYNDRKYEDGLEGYTCNLDVLLKVDKNLNDDPGVTFIFLACDSSGFTLTTNHRCSDMEFVYTD